MFVWVEMLKGHPLRLYWTSSLLFIVSVSFSSYEGTAASSTSRSWFCHSNTDSREHLVPLKDLCAFSWCVDVVVWCVEMRFCNLESAQPFSSWDPKFTESYICHLFHVVFESWMKRYMWAKSWCCKHWTDFMASRCATELGGDNNASMTTGEVRKIFLLLQSQDLKRTFKKMASRESRNFPSCLLSK